MANGAESAIRDNRWSQWSPASGLAFIVLFVVGMLLFKTPDKDDTQLQIVGFYADKGNRAQLIIAAYLLVLAGVFFFWFLASLRDRLRVLEGGTGRLTSIVFGSGIVFIAMLMVTAGCFMFVPGEITFGDKGVPPDVARVLPDMGWAFLLIGGAFSAIAMIDAASVLMVRTGIFPRWVAWLGFAAAVVLLFAALVFPIVALLVWVGVVSLALLQMNGVNVPGMGHERPSAAS
jgi:hypothetical protein